MAKQENKKVYDIKTDLLTVEKTLDILKECELDHLLLGADENKELKPLEVFRKLFMKKKLRDLLNTITGGQIKDNDVIEQEEAHKILSGFFLAFFSTWTIQTFIPRIKQN